MQLAQRTSAPRATSVSIKDSGLHGHVQGTGNASALQGLQRAILFAQGHEAWHFVFSQADLVPSRLSEGKISNFELERGSSQHTIIVARFSDHTSQLHPGV